VGSGFPKTSCPHSTIGRAPPLSESAGEIVPLRVLRALRVRKIRCSISGVPARNRASFIRFWAIFVFASPFAAQLIPLPHHPSKMRSPKILRTLDSFCPTSPATLKPKTQNYELNQQAQCSPGGTSENSPAFQRRENRPIFSSPEGTADSGFRYKSPTRNQRLLRPPGKGDRSNAP
jgi:hypothetical protein